MITLAFIINSVINIFLNPYQMTHAPINNELFDDKNGAPFLFTPLFLIEQHDYIVIHVLKTWIVHKYIYIYILFIFSSAF